MLMIFNGVDTMRTLIIQGRKWFRKSYGNTYHTVTVAIDGEQVYNSPIYSGNHCEQTARMWLVKYNHLPNDYGCLGSWCQDNNVLLVSIATNVVREKDL